MVFSSVTFLFLFLPVVLVIYHLVCFLPVTLGSRNPVWWRLSNLFLLLASLVFYYWGEKSKVWIFIGTTFFDYLCALVISRAVFTSDFADLSPSQRRHAWQRIVLILSICCNLALLAYFKYFNFAADSYNAVVGSLGHPSWQWDNVKTVVLPLGISFFTFHSMSYTIDVYNGRVRATRNFIDYACYVLMFPQLVAGPIVRYSYVAKSLTSRLITAHYFASGVARFILGLSKKVLIANTVAIAADRIFALPAATLTPGVAWLGAAAYTLQIYFDFSGYSDMAVGLGRMFGFELPQNFNYPYIARSVREFWHRWHISLSTWFQDYLYIPLGGSRGSRSRTGFNLLLVFFLCGLWHGAKWTFVVWGLYHGLFLVLERHPAFSSWLKRAFVLGHVYTLLVVMGGWVLFRADTFTQAARFFATMAGRQGGPSPYSIGWFLTTDVLIAMIAGIVFSAPLLTAAGHWLDHFLANLDPLPKRLVVPTLSFARVAGLMLMIFLCSMSLASGTHNPFIYFRF
jgi:alginate O-acetyltransferase complex protein AlgI